MAEMTTLAPASLSVSALISPVKAPAASTAQSSPPMAKHPSVTSTARASSRPRPPRGNRLQRMMEAIRLGFGDCDADCTEATAQVVDLIKQQ